MILLTADKIRSIVADCKTEQDIIFSLRSHKIKCGFSTETGFTTIRIPYRKGVIHIYRSCNRSCPFVVRSNASLPYSWN